MKMILSIWNGTTAGVLLRAVLLLVAVGLAGCLGRQDRPGALEREIVLAASGTSAQIRLRAPIGYIFDDAGWWEPHMPPSAETQSNWTESVLFHATWPDLGPRQHSNKELFRDPRGPGITILVRMREATVNMGFSKAMASHYRSTRDLESYGRSQLLVTLPDRWGLAVEALPESMRGERYPVGLTEREFDRILTPKGEAPEPSLVIVCTDDAIPEPRPGTKGSRVPSCSMQYPNQRLRSIVKVTFRRIHLPDWQLMRSRVDGLLESFLHQ